MTAELDGLNWN